MRFRRVSFVGDETGQFDLMTSFAFGLRNMAGRAALDEDPAAVESTDRGDD